MCSMANFKKLRLKGAALKRLLSVVLVTLLGVSLLVVSLRTNTTPGLTGLDEDSSETIDIQSFSVRLNLPKLINEFSVRLEKPNQLPPRNKDLYPKLAEDHITIVLYVHNRPQYLRVVVESLSKVVGISETLLIVSHDGYFEEMNKIVEGIKFCQVKQIFAPYSPHVFTDSFPGVSSDDSSLVVDDEHGLNETRGHDGHILFVEEDHFIYPNAYRNLQLLVSLKPNKCPDCYAANLAPWDVNARGEGWGSLVAERMGNIGYNNGQGLSNVCIDNGAVNIQVDDVDKVANIRSEWDLHVYRDQAGFKGWGGWGDHRDRQLCLNFARMYRLYNTSLAVTSLSFPTVVAGEMWIIFFYSS
ncbi:hypothetical protein V6N12_058038 [Hibiscus sabdariffa]|uniref:Alpha-1,6-mannosyl-glycoprotein 2-beta-N-acetylglucosaminyltransferase n=1 Tax=Hibiscus sabdariffa TaxID=183260 RepID=A0ABR1ZE04_9ROSI